MLGRHLLAAALLALMIPGVGLFCWHVLVATDPETTHSGGESAGFRPAEDLLRNGNGYAGRLKQLSSPFYNDLRKGDSDDPFQTGISREMVAAQGDPFLFAHFNGANEGSLVSKSHAGGIRTLGIPFPLAGLSQTTRNEVLRNIEQGLGGSLKNFFAKVLGAQHQDPLELPQDEESADENPFSRAIESMKGTGEAEKTSLAEVKSEKSGSKDQTPPAAPKDPTPVKQAVVGGSSVNTVRPYFMLKVEPDGSLRATAMSQPRSGTFESAEFGPRDFKVFPMTDPAEYPISMAVADFNGDSYPDLAFHVALQGTLRFFFGTPDGDFVEGLRIEVGSAPRSLAAGDFNHDGFMDLALSNLGTGSLTLLLGDADGPCRHYKSFWLDVYRDYITAADNPELGAFEVLGMNFANQATVLVDFTGTEGKTSARKTSFTPAFNTNLPLGGSRSGRLNAVILGSSLSVNFENRQHQLFNILNLAPGTDIQILTGDLDNNGTIDIGLAIPIR